MKPCNIPHQIIETVAGYIPGSVQIYPLKLVHDIGMIWNLKIRHNRLSKLLKFHILTVVFTYGNTRINNIWYHQHALIHFIGKF